MIAIGVACNPRRLIADEATTAVDVTVQAQILALLETLQRDLGLTYLFISHDLAVVRQIADTVSVLQAGRQVDAGRVEDPSPERRTITMTLSTPSPTKRLGFFSRLLDDVPAGERYRLVTEQIAHAEAFGFDSAWVAQHHFHAHEGGLPSPFVFLAHVAARTRRIRLGTGIVTLPMENAVRVAEDAIVLDLLSGGRLELGVGTGGTPESFAAFGITSDDRSAVYARHLALVLNGLRGRIRVQADGQMKTG
eukprot:gene42377-51757_t